jgi:hypothetical protein
MHDFVCMRCGEEIDRIYRSKNPDYEGWDLCVTCLKECDAEMAPDAGKG